MHKKTNNENTSGIANNTVSYLYPKRNGFRKIIKITMHSNKTKNPKIKIPAV